MFKAEQFLSDHHIDYTTTGKHARAGWVQIRCPVCSGNPGWHGGINIEHGFFNCWRHGSTWLPKIVSILLDIPISEAKRVIYKYSTPEGRRAYRKPQHIRPDRLKTPDLQPLTPVHARYLEQERGFDPEQLKRLWGIQSTGLHGYYKHRIFIPVLFEWGVVSYQCMSPTGFPPYLGCKEVEEIIPHKHLLYGFDYAVEKRKCVVVEGVTDVWRLGPGAVATFGEKWTKEQLTLLCNNFERVTVMLDSDVPRDRKKKLADNILAHGVPLVDNIDLLTGDPGDLLPDQAQGVMLDLGF